MLKIAAFPTELFVSGKQWRPRSGLLRIIGWGWKGNRNEDQNWGNLLHIEISQTQSSLRSLIFLKGGRIELLGFYSHIDIHSVKTVAWAMRASWPGSLGEVPLNLNKSFIVALSEGQEISVSHSKESVHQPKSETPLCLLKTLQSNPLGDRGWSLTYKTVHSKASRQHRTCLCQSFPSSSNGCSWALPPLPYPLFGFN